MCQHNKFTILVYQKGVLIRQCDDCGEVEIKTEDWVNLKDLEDAIDNARCQNVLRVQEEENKED